LRQAYDYWQDQPGFYRNGKALGYHGFAIKLLPRNSLKPHPLEKRRGLFNNDLVKNQLHQITTSLRFSYLKVQASTPKIPRKIPPTCKHLIDTFIQTTVLRFPIILNAAVIAAKKRLPPQTKQSVKVRLQSRRRVSKLQYPFSRMFKGYNGALSSINLPHSTLPS
jgi:hypothetical protein